MASRRPVRPAEPGDHAVFTRLFLELGVPEPPPGLEAWQGSMMPRTVFIDVDGEPVAFAFYDLLRTCGYVRNLAVAPSHRRQGLGRDLMWALADQFRALGCREWRLNVKADNEAAIALYRGCGMRSEYLATSLSMPVAGVSRLVETPEVRESVRVRDLPEELDAEVEALFDMPEGLITSLRGRTGSLFLQLVDESRAGAQCVDKRVDKCLGVARFSPQHPGAFPFRVQRPDVVRRFLEAMTPALAPGVTHFGLVCEDDPALAETLAAAGAEVLLEIVHMRGLLDP